MRTVFSVFLTFLLFQISGCASTGARYEDMKSTLSKVPDDSVRIFFLRTHESSLYLLRDARIRIDDKPVGGLGKGNFLFKDVTPGRLKLTVDMWDIPGDCTLHLNAKAGEEYYFEVTPRTDSLIAFLAGGAIGNAIEGSWKDCGGAFAFQVHTKEFAEHNLSSLRGKMTNN